MRLSVLFSGIAALLAAASFCQAYEPPSRGARAKPPACCEAAGPRGFYIGIRVNAFGTTLAFGPVKAKDAGPCRTTAATRDDLGLPPCCGMPAARVTRAATGTACSGQADGGQLVCVPPVPAATPTVESCLAKLEALKAKMAELQAEVKKEQAALKQLLDELHRRVNKVGLDVPVVPTVPPVPSGLTPTPSSLAPLNTPWPLPPGTPAPPGSKYTFTPQYGPASTPPASGLPGPSAPPGPAR